jgi:hypothetical protein
VNWCNLLFTPFLLSWSGLDDPAFEAAHIGFSNYSFS